jgi:hypothetical protein
MDVLHTHLVQFKLLLRQIIGLKNTTCMQVQLFLVNGHLQSHGSVATSQAQPGCYLKPHGIHAATIYMHKSYTVGLPGPPSALFLMVRGRSGGVHMKKEGRP